MKARDIVVGESYGPKAHNQYAKYTVLARVGRLPAEAGHMNGRRITGGHNICHFVVMSTLAMPVWHSNVEIVSASELHEPFDEWLKVHKDYCHAEALRDDAYMTRRAEARRLRKLICEGESPFDPRDWEWDYWDSATWIPCPVEWVYSKLPDAKEE